MSSTSQAFGPNEPSAARDAASTGADGPPGVESDEVTASTLPARRHVTVPTRPSKGQGTRRKPPDIVLVPWTARDDGLDGAPTTALLWTAISSAGAP